MPILKYSSAGFPKHLGASLTGPGQLNVSWAELIWAAVSVGKSETAHLSRFGIFSSYEMLYRMAIIYANLYETNSQKIGRSDAYSALDPSEKGAISYFLGLTTAKLLAARLLDVPWLMHLDVYRHSLLPRFRSQSKAKPDLVGLTRRREWVVIEAKGRTGSRDPAALKKAKEQTRALRMIGGAYPVLRIAHQAFFSRNYLHTEWNDPEAINQDAPDLLITPIDLLSDYYAPFNSILDDQPFRIDNDSQPREYRSVLFAELDVTIGRRSISSVENQSEPLPADSSRFEGKDGIVIELGPTWSNDRMRQQPRDRTSLRAVDRVL